MVKVLNTRVNIQTKLGGFCCCCRHENASGFYRVSVYFVAKIFCDMIPMRIAPASVFAVIAYFMVGE